MEAADRLHAALEHHRRGDLDSARGLYEEVLREQPGHPDALHLLGLIAHQRGQHTVALAFIRRAIAVQPGAAAYHTNLGTVLLRLGRAEDAMASYRLATSLDPHNVAAHLGLARALRQVGRIQEALHIVEHELSMAPPSAEALILTAQLQTEIGQRREAVDTYRAALAIDPHNAAAHGELGAALFDLRKYDEACESCETALRLDPLLWTARLKLAAILNCLGRPADALRELDQAALLAPDHAGLHSLRGVALLSLGRLRQAIDNFAASLQRDASYPPAHYNLGIANLMAGNLREGWREYEWRGASQQFENRRGTIPQPVWRGESLLGRRILVHAEQGLGDAIQFVRFVPRLAELGAQVILECLAPLQRLLQSIPAIERVITVDEPLPAFDVRIPLMSLPHVFDTTLETLPREIPYLRVPEELTQAWRTRLGGGDSLKVGVVWAGSRDHVDDFKRSMPVSALDPIVRTVDAQFFSLYKPPAGVPGPTVPRDLAMTDLAPQLTDFAETAAAIQCLDVTISVDTAVAHLAGALGKPTWVLLPFVPDWRWLLNRNDSPWYPTVRLFRQKTPGDWGTVVQDVMMSLIELARQHRNGSPSA